MATVPQGQSQVVSLGPNDAIKVSTPGEAYVDHLSGTPESPYASTRLVNTTSPKVFGPYGVKAQLRVRAIELSALYDGYTDPQPALVNSDPTTGQTADIGGVSVLQTPITDSGSYVSDGNARKITLGFKPTWVVLKANGTTVLVQKTAAQWFRQTDTFTDGAASRAHAITLNDDGFTAETDATVNTSGTTYYWFAIGDNGAGVVNPASWQGNATAGRKVYAYQGKKLAFVATKRDATYSPAWANGITSHLEDGTAGSYIQFNSDGVLTLDASNNTNQWLGVSGEGCNAFALVDDPDNVYVFNYQGNSATRRIPLPWEPEFVMILPRTVNGSKVQLWMSSLPADSTALSNGAANQSGRITSVVGNSVSLAAQTSVNSSSHQYTLVAIRKRRLAATRLLQAPAAIKRTGKSIQLNNGYIDCGLDNSLALTGDYTLEFYGAVYPADETVFAGGAGVNDELNKQYPLIFRSQGADGGSSTTTVSWGMALLCPLPYGPAGEWTGVALTTPPGQWWNLPQQGSGTNLDYFAINSGHVVNAGQVAHIVQEYSSAGIYRLWVDGVLVKERSRDLRTAVGGPLKPNAAYPLQNARTVIGARQRGGANPEFAHQLNFRLARVWNRMMNPGEVVELHRCTMLGLPAPKSDFVEEWDARNASGLILPATVSAANNGTIVNGLVI